MRFRASLGFILTASILLAQSTPKPIKVTTRLVQINVLVHDHHGNPIADLTKEDFEIADNGRPQQVAVFTVDSLFAPNPAAGPKTALPVLPRNVATNRPERQANAPVSATVLLLDMYNTKVTDQMRARKQIIKFLKQIRPEDRVAVYVLKGEGFSVVHDFTNSSEGLLAALAKVVPGFSHELDGSDMDPSNTGDDNLDAFIDTSNTLMSNFYIRNRVINTCLSFKMLANHLAGVPGRKSVVWVSGGFPIAFGYGDEQDTTDQTQIGAISANTPPRDRELFADYIESASQAMNTANVVVYPVDARGLMGLPFVDASKNIKINPRTHQMPQSMTHVDQRNIDSMNYIADLTGGKAFYNTNDIDGAIRKAVDDSSVTYTLGYYVPEENWDNKFHKLKVKVRRSGVTIRTKKGYLALEQPAPTPVKLDQILHEAVWSPLDSTTIGVAGRIDPSPALPNSSRLYLGLDPAELQFQQDDQKYLGSLDVVFVQQTKRGKLVANFKKTYNMTFTSSQLEQLKAKGFRASQDLQIDPDTQAVRIVIMDRTSGATGSVTLNVTGEDKSGATVAASPAQTQPKTPN